MFFEQYSPYHFGALSHLLSRPLYHGSKHWKCLPQSPQPLPRQIWHIQVFVLGEHLLDLQSSSVWHLAPNFFGLGILFLPVFPMQICSRHSLWCWRLIKIWSSEKCLASIMKYECDKYSPGRAFNMSATSLAPGARCVRKFCLCLAKYSHRGNSHDTSYSTEDHYKVLI